MSGSAPVPPPGWESAKHCANGVFDTYYRHGAFGYKYFRHPIQLWDGFARLALPPDISIRTQQERG